MITNIANTGRHNMFPFLEKRRIFSSCILSAALLINNGNSVQNCRLNTVKRDSHPPHHDGSARTFRDLQFREAYGLSIIICENCSTISITA
jgi:hypothetical protein